MKVGDSWDLHKYVLIMPEADLNRFIKLSEEKGFTLTNPLRKNFGLFTLNAIGVPHEEVNQVIDDLNELKDSIKREQLEYYDAHSDELSFRGEMTNLVAKFIVEANKNKNVNPNQIFLLLKSVLGDLCKYSDSYPAFVDNATLEKIADAVSSKEITDAEANFDQALINIVVQIRMMMMIWYFDELSLSYYNLRTDRNSVSDYTGTKCVEFFGNTCTGLNLTIHGEKISTKYSEIGKFVLTFNEGKHTQNALMPFFHLIFIDRGSLRVYIEYSKIIIKSVKRLKAETLKAMQEIKFDYDETSI
jgi:hypothetical protein